MSVSLPNGALVAISTAFAAADPVTALTNASPAAATSTAHGNANGSIVRINSGWSGLDGRVARVANTATNSFDMEGIDTANTSLYPAGGGTGSVEAVTGWTQLSQILSSSSNGGEQQFVDYQFLNDKFQKRLPTIKTANGWTLEVADDPAQAGYILCAAADNDRNPRVVRITLPNGALIFFNARITLNSIPKLTVNEVMAVTITMSFENEATRYTS